MPADSKTMLQLSGHWVWVLVSTRLLTSLIHLDFLFWWVTVSSVIAVGGNQLNGQCYLMCFVTSSSCPSRHLCWYICLGVQECQAASVVAAACLPASLHDIWSWTHQKWFNSWNYKSPFNPVRTNCQSARVEPSRTDLPAQLIWGAL